MDSAIIATEKPCQFDSVVVVTNLLISITDLKIPRSDLKSNILQYVNPFGKNKPKINYTNGNQILTANVHS